MGLDLPHQILVRRPWRSEERAFRDLACDTFGKGGCAEGEPRLGRHSDNDVDEELSAPRGRNKPMPADLTYLGPCSVFGHLIPRKEGVDLVAGMDAGALQSNQRKPLVNLGGVRFEVILVSRRNRSDRGLEGGLDGVDIRRYLGGGVLVGCRILLYRVGIECCSCKQGDS